TVGRLRLSASVSRAKTQAVGKLFPQDFSVGRLAMISLVVPVYQEAANIQEFLRGVESAVREPHEIVIVYDFPEDNTLPAIAALEPPCPAVRLVHNTLGKGVLNALKAGLQASRGDV